MMFAFLQDESEGQYEEGEIAQKVLQEFRCAVLNGTTEFKSGYLSRLPIRDRVVLAGQTFEICLEYDDVKKILLSETISQSTGSYDKSSWKDYSKTPPVPKVFTNMYSIGGLTVYTNTDDFATYLKPTEQSVKKDLDNVLAEINISDGFVNEELVKLKSVAACATKHLTAQQRYDILVKLAPKNTNIVETKEDLILDLFETSVYGDDLDVFVDLLKADASLFKTLFTQIDDITYDFWNNENNKTRLLETLYSVWNLSNESKVENHTYPEYAPLVYYYNAGGTFERTFSIENDDFRFSGTDICARKYIDDEGYTPDKCYNIFQPICVAYDEDEKVKFPSKEIPAFYLMGYHDLANIKARMTSLNITVDAISLFAGVGGLAEIKNLPKAYKLAKIVISGLEISSTVADMVLNYSSACEGNSELCAKLQAYNFWLQMATLSSDIVVSKMAKKAAKEALAIADESLPTDIKKHLENVVGSSANTTNKWLDDFVSTTGVNIRKVNDENILNKAKQWQGKGDYPGIDDWEVYEIPAGTKIYGGLPGQSEFYSTFDNLVSVNYDKVKYWESLQVLPRAKEPYLRAMVGEYIIKENIKVAISRTLANPQISTGGGWQIFVDDFSTNLQFVKEISLK